MEEILDQENQKAPKPRFKLIFIVLLFILAAITIIIGGLFTFLSWEGGTAIFWSGAALFVLAIMLLFFRSRDKKKG